MPRTRDEQNDAEKRGPSAAQLEAALEGAGDPINFNTAHRDDPESARPQRSGGGGSGPSTGSAQGGSTSTAGPMDSPEGPQQETEGREAPAPRRAVPAAVVSIRRGPSRRRTRRSGQARDSGLRTGNDEEAQMKRPISTRTHGIIDYTYAAALIMLPFIRGWRGRAAQLSIGAGLATLGLSMLTDYELGIVRLIPMKGHLAIDAAESSMLLASPKMLGDDDREAGRLLATMGGLGGAVGGLTQTQPTRLAHDASW